MWAICEQFIKKNRFPWREKREYVDSYDRNALARVIDGTSKYEILRSIRVATPTDCKKFHDMFVEFANVHNEVVDEHGTSNENKIFVHSSYSYHPKANSCIILSYPMSTNREETHEFYEMRDNRD